MANNMQREFLTEGQQDQTDLAWEVEYSQDQKEMDNMANEGGYERD